MFELEIIACRQSFGNMFRIYRDELSDEMRKVFSNDYPRALISDSNIIFNKINLVDVRSKRIAMAI